MAGPAYEPARRVATRTGRLVAAGPGLCQVPAQVPVRMRTSTFRSRPHASGMHEREKAPRRHRARALAVLHVPARRAWYPASVASGSPLRPAARDLQYTRIYCRWLISELEPYQVPGA